MTEPTRITPYQDGPLIVRGDFELTDDSGNSIPAVRGTVALCRCGVSTIKPFCDGTHKAINFRTEPASPHAADDVVDAVAGPESQPSARATL